MVMEYTKGEWQTDYDEAEKGYFIRNVLEDGSGESMAFVYPSEDYDITANANLIASAPDLYEALKHICDRLYGVAGNEKLVSPELYTLLRALYREGYDAVAKANGNKAIAKAEGGK